MKSTSFLFSKRYQCGEFSQVWCSPDRPEVLGARPPTEPCQFLSGRLSWFGVLGFKWISPTRVTGWYILWAPEPKRLPLSCFYLDNPVGSNPFTLSLCPWQLGKCEPYRPRHLPAFPAAQETCDISWIFVIFTDNLLIVFFSLRAHVFLSSLLFKNGQDVRDVIHFSLISMCCHKPFGLWSLFLLIDLNWTFYWTFTWTLNKREHGNASLPSNLCLIKWMGSVSSRMCVSL